MTALPALLRFIHVLEARNAEDCCPARVSEAVTAAPPETLPASFREWLQVSPFEWARFGGNDLAASPASLRKCLHDWPHLTADGYLPFGWAEDMGSYLAFPTTGGGATNEPQVFAIDHEDGKSRGIGTFPELVRAWTDYLEREGAVINDE
jgi:hypothetical protein